MAEVPDAPRPLTDDMLEAREDFEKGMSVVPPVTLALIVVCVAVHVRQLFHSIAAPGLLREVLILPGAMNRERVLEGEWWRVLTATWLHASPDHLIGNMAALFILGMGCEHAFGSARTLAVYALAGIAGSLAGMSHAEPSVGASGAVFGLLGLLASALWVHRERLVLRDRRLPTVLLCWAVYALLGGAVTPYIDNMAHAGGFVTGLLAGRLLKPREPGPPGPAAQVAAGAAAAGLLYALYRLRHGLIPFVAVGAFMTRASALLLAAVLGFAAAPVSAAAPAAAAEETAFWSRVIVDPSLPPHLRERTTVAITRLLAAPSLRERIRVLGSSWITVHVTTCAPTNSDASTNLPYRRYEPGEAGHVEWVGYDLQACWDESLARQTPEIMSGRPEEVIAHELFGHAPTQILQRMSGSGTRCLAYRSEDELSARMIGWVAVRELGYPIPFGLPDLKAMAGGLAAYEKYFTASHAAYAHSLTAAETKTPLASYEKRRAFWSKACRANVPRSCEAAKFLTRLIDQLRGEAYLKRLMVDLACPNAPDLIPGLRRESEKLRRELLILKTGFEHTGKPQLAPRADGAGQFGAPIPSVEEPLPR